MVDRGLIGGEATLEIARLPSKKPRSGDQNLILMALQPRNLQHPNAEHWRVRLASVASGDAATIADATIALVRPGSTLQTSAWPGFNDLKPQGYRHVINAAHLSSPGQLITEQGRRAFRALELWLGGEMNWAIRRLDSYLQEFAFRHNTPDHYNGLFMAVLERAWRTPFD